MEKWLHFEEFWKVSLAVVKNLPLWTCYKLIKHNKYLWVILETQNEKNPQPASMAKNQKLKHTANGLTISQGESVLYFRAGCGSQPAGWPAHSRPDLPKMWRNLKIDVIVIDRGYDSMER